MQEQTDIIYITAVMCIHWRAFEFGCWMLGFAKSYNSNYSNLSKSDYLFEPSRTWLFLAWKLSIYIEFNQGYSREPATINLDVSA